MTVEPREIGCQHQDWQATVTVRRPEAGVAGDWLVELEMGCVVCLTPMQWVDLPVSDRTIIGSVASLSCQPFAVGRAS